MKRISQAKQAELLGISQSFISEVLSGKKRMTRKKALELEAKSGIPAAVWMFGTLEELRAAVSAWAEKQATTEKRAA